MDPTILASRSAFLDKSIVNDVPWSKLELCFPFNGEVHPFIITSGFFYIYAGMTIQYYIILYHISHEPPQQYFQIPKKSSHHETDEETDTQQLQHLLSELQVGVPALRWLEVEKVEIWEQLQGP